MIKAVAGCSQTRGTAAALLYVDMVKILPENFCKKLNRNSPVSIETAVQTWNCDITPSVAYGDSSLL